MFSCAGDECFNTDTADLLWNHGFRDFPQHWTGDRGMFRMIFVYGNDLCGRLRYLERQIEVGAWMKARGVFPEDSTVEHTEMMLSFATRIGNMAARRWFEPREFSECSLQLSSDALAFLQSILSTGHLDMYPCGCAPQGCAGLDRMLRAMLDVMQAPSIHGNLCLDTEAVIQDILAFFWPIGLASSESTFEESILRILLFSQAGLRHVCCVPDEATFERQQHASCTPERCDIPETRVRSGIEADCREELHQELFEEMDWFETCYKALLDRRRASMEPFASWLKQSFESVAAQVLLSDTPVDNDYIQIVEDLGVTVHQNR